MIEFKIGDKVKCPHNQEGIIVDINTKSLDWFPYRVKIEKATLSELGTIERYKKEQLSLTDKSIIINKLEQKLCISSISKGFCCNYKCKLHQAKHANTCSRKICIYSDVITTNDGKYVTINNNGHLIVFRNGEFWREQDLIGDTYVLSLVQKIAELEEKYENK